MEGIHPVGFSAESFLRVIQGNEYKSNYRAAVFRFSASSTTSIWRIECLCKNNPFHKLLEVSAKNEWR